MSIYLLSAVCIIALKFFVLVLICGELYYRSCCMKIYSMGPVVQNNRNNVSTKQNKSNNVSFSGFNWNALIASNMDFKTVMRQLRKDGYIIQGYSNARAFENFYTRIENRLKGCVKSGEGIWANTKPKHPYWYTVHPLPMGKEKFVKLAGEYWDYIKTQQVNSNYIYEFVEHFLCDVKQVKRPSFKSYLTENCSDYYGQQNMLVEMTNNFLFTGQHRLT